MRQFEQMDIFCANSSIGIANSRDKLRTLQILSRHHIGIPQTAFIRDRKDVMPRDRTRGGCPRHYQVIGGYSGSWRDFGRVDQDSSGDSGDPSKHKTERA